mmetsp:Transcript_43909/g.110686  ORF Transcript_43909/g.110686 Transcript_43909/m.110686 type:complete len:109 (+) Transcript_43909:90-416(+)|eukprot:CAMPEP_0177629836 /NCGR_PEP_ID=MMETSP0447-20121125/879_1 /TAXON_ID=0 /ORGANISM="Stygamoeba regulata, Strain BSH-02190019" /LENGTH=108 /DNA_ID=CAMNT_0019131181 /DNA_START=79 /DNA_END=405 /DNA_ORIENTATION=+
MGTSEAPSNCTEGDDPVFATKNVYTWNATATSGKPGKEKMRLLGGKIATLDLQDNPAPSSDKEDFDVPMLYVTVETPYGTFSGFLSDTTLERSFEEDFEKLLQHHLYT